MTLRRAWLTALVAAATLAILVGGMLVGGVLVGGVLIPAAASAAHAATATAPAAEVPFTSIPPVTTQPAANEPGETQAPQPSGSWEPAGVQRILLVQPDLGPESTSEDLAPGLLREADRLGHELVEAGLVAQPPKIAYTSPAYAEQQADASQLVLRVDDADSDGEDAEIAVADSGVTITAADATGIFRGSRALLQTLIANGAVGFGTYQLSLPNPTRSVHLDVARKRYDLDTIEQLLLQMSWTGLNELELHFSENEGWAIASDEHPEIASDDAYTKDEIRELVSYAADLHIRVTPSLDMPGHLDHVLESHPEWQLLAADGSPVFGALDITNPDAREFALGLIDEYAELFEPGAWNLGADEFVDFADESEVATLSDYARTNIGPDANASDALTEFVNDADARLQDHEYEARVWSDGMLKGNSVELNSDITVAYWTTRPAEVASVDEFAANGNPLLNVNDEYLYFVLGERVGYVYPTGEAILSEWDAGAFPGGQVAGAEAEVSGGMFAIWSDIPEALDDAELLERVRLPLAAVSWKLAAPDEVPSWEEFQELRSAVEDAAAIDATADGSGAEGMWPPPSPGPTSNETAGTSADTTASLWPWIAAGAAVVVAGVIVTVVLMRRRSR